MLFNLHIDEWMNYCSIIYSPTVEVKNSVPAHSKLLKLVHKYYSISIEKRKKCDIYFKSLLFISPESNTEVD